MTAGHSSSSDLPLVSVGMPVFNGEQFIRPAIESVLAQDYPNFELVICDNLSTDATADICREYVRADPRVRYVRNAENFGVIRNFELTVAHAKGKYFTWLAHDDFLYPHFISSTVGFMESAPDVVTCGCAIEHVDYWKPGISEIQSFPEISPQRDWRKARLEFFRWPQPDVHFLVYGMHRREPLSKLSLRSHQAEGVPPVLAMEYAILVPLIAFGRMVALPDPLRGYRARIHAASHRVESEMSRWDKFLFGLAIRRMVVRQLLKLDIPRGEAIELLWLGLRNFFVGNWSRPKDHSVTIAGLRNVIYDLRNTCEERLQLIERLHRANEEQRQAIRGLLEENASLRESYRRHAETSGKVPGHSETRRVSKGRFRDIIAPFVPTSLSRVSARFRRKY